MKSFKQFLVENQGIDQIAGVEFDDDNYRFKIKDLIKHSEEYPIVQIDPQSLSDNLEGREGEDFESQQRRTKNADTNYPIILTHRDDGDLHVLDGTHRLQKAIENNHDSISARIIPRGEMKRYKTS